MNRAKVKADLSLQFFRDKNGTMNFLVTTNETELELQEGPSIVDYFSFGKGFAALDTLSKAEKLWVCKIFKEAEKILSEPPTDKQEGE